MTPTAVRILWELYQIDCSDGDRWVEVGQVAVNLQVHPDSIHRVLMAMKPRKLLVRNQKHPRQWRIAEPGRAVGRCIEGIIERQRHP